LHRYCQFPVCHMGYRSVIGHEGSYKIPAIMRPRKHQQQHHGISRNKGRARPVKICLPTPPIKSIRDLESISNPNRNPQLSSSYRPYSKMSTIPIFPSAMPPTYSAKHTTVVTQDRHGMMPICTQESNEAEDERPTQQPRTLSSSCGARAIFATSWPPRTCCRAAPGAGSS